MLKKGYRWKIGKENEILESFPTMDARLILNTPTSGIRKQDEIIWNRENKGVFTIKSAYHLASNLATAQKASSSNAMKHDPEWKEVLEAKSHRQGEDMCLENYPRHSPNQDEYL